MRTPKRHVFEIPFEIPASKTARSGRPRAKHVQHNNASEQLDHQLQIPQRETNVNPSASERAAYRAKRKNLETRPESQLAGFSTAPKRRNTVVNDVFVHATRFNHP